VSDPRTEDDESRERDIGQGYPEEAPPGIGIDAREHPEQDIGADDAPDTSKSEDGDPGQATGNPRAAGG
jgi:hypothetical protein